MQTLKQLLLTGVYVCMVTSVQAQTLPEGEGKQIIANSCSQCHQLRLVTDARHTREQWVYIVSMMITMGATVPGDKIITVVDYLSENFGMVEGASTVPATDE